MALTVTKVDSATGETLSEQAFSTFAEAIASTGIPRSEWIIDSLSSAIGTDNGRRVIYYLCDMGKEG